MEKNIRTIEPILLLDKNSRNNSAFLDNREEEMYIKLIRKTGESIVLGKTEIINIINIDGNQFGKSCCVMNKGRYIRQKCDLYTKIITPSYIVSGNYDNICNIKFNRVTFEVFDLNSFIQKKIFKYQSGNIKIDEKMPIYNFELLNNISVSIKHSCYSNWEGMTLNIKQQIIIDFNFNKNKSLQDIHEYINASTSFIALLSSKYPYVENVKVYRMEESLKENLFINKLNLYSTREEMIYNVFFYEFNEIQHSLKPCLEKWFKIYKKIKLPIEKFMYSIYQEGLHYDTRFKEVLSAIEGIHKHFSEDKKTTLSKRIKDIFKEMNIEHNNSFIKISIDTRNEFTHMISRNNKIFSKIELEEVLPFYIELFKKYLLFKIGLKKLKIYNAKIIEKFE